MSATAKSRKMIYKVTKPNKETIEMSIDESMVGANDLSAWIMFCTEQGYSFDLVRYEEV